MDSAANAEAQIEQTYRRLAQIVRSDQMPHEDVQKILMADPQFAAWYNEYAKSQPGGG